MCAVPAIAEELERHTALMQQIKEKSKERKALVAEKKELSIYHVKRHKALAVHIAELTEDLEELPFIRKRVIPMKYKIEKNTVQEKDRKSVV